MQKALMVFFESIKENLKFMVVHWEAIFQENSSKQKADNEN